MATAVHTWLRGNGAFDAGVALLKQHCEDEDDALLFLLSLGETTVSRRALRTALEEVRDAAVERTHEVQATSRTPSVVTKADIRRERKELARDPRSDGYDGVDLPPELASVRDQVRAKLKEMNYLQYNLENLPSDSDRHRDAKRIVALDKEIVSAYGRLDRWKESGTDPGESPEELPKNGAQLATELRNLVSYISRHNSGQRTANPERLEKWKARKKTIEAELDAMS